MTHNLSRRDLLITAGIAPVLAAWRQDLRSATSGFTCDSLPPTID